MAALFCAAISCSTSARSSRTRSKMPFASWTAKAILEVHLGWAGIAWPPSRKKRLKFAAVVAATSSRPKFLTFASVCATSTTWAGSFLLPRRPWGERKGESVSVRIWSRGRFAATSRICWALGEDVGGEGNEEAHFQAALGFAQRASEAVKNSAQARGGPFLFKDRQAIVPGVAAMNDDWQLCVAGLLQLAAENWLLCFGRWLFVVIVEAHLAPGDYFGIFRQGVELRVVLFLGFGGVWWVDSDGGVNPVVVFGYCDGGIEVVWTGAAAADG